jgi:ABC-type sugar transport system ATPase subunit
VSPLFISLIVWKIKEIGNSGTILRDGKFITNIEDVKKVDINEIISYVVGRPLVQIFLNEMQKLEKFF